MKNLCLEQLFGVSSNTGAEGKAAASAEFTPRGQVSPAGDAISVIGGRPRQTDTRRRRRPRAPRQL